MSLSEYHNKKNKFIFYEILVFLGLLFIFASCYHKTETKNIDLPDSTLISEVILKVIDLDSLNFNHNIGISKHRVNAIHWNTKEYKNNHIAPPPPNTMPYNFFFENFESGNNTNKRYKDSVFVTLQTDTAYKYKISDFIISRFDKKSKRCYLFDIPIFSSDKSFVYINYWDYCGPLCGTCYSLILKKSKNNWIKVKQWLCGVS